MPRVHADGSATTEWCERTGNGASIHDLCRNCSLELQADPKYFNDELKVYNSGEPEAEFWGGDAEHPCYRDVAMDGEPYCCEVCKEELTVSDN